MKLHTGLSSTDILQVTYEEQKMLAYEYSEGSYSLEKLLSKLWLQNIETIGCCAGNHNDEMKEPYIAMVINGNSFSYINSLITIIGGLSGIRINIFNNGELVNFSIIFSQYLNEKGFQILNSISPMDLKYNNIFTTAIMLSQCAYQSNKDFRLEYSENGIFCSLTRENQLVPFERKNASEYNDYSTYRKIILDDNLMLKLDEKSLIDLSNVLKNNNKKIKKLNK